MPLSLPFSVLPAGRAAAPLLAAALLLALAGCGSAPKPASPGTPAPVATPRTDGPPASRSQGATAVPDAVPRIEPLSSGANRKYRVLGRTYVPSTADERYPQQGMASWYGRKFHGKRTSNGEVYDMYAMTAAHPTLPIPSYARVRHLASGRTVIVRVNDRGPFLRGRIIDLSYVAARRLGIVEKGSAMVAVERITHAEIRDGSWRLSDGAHEPGTTAPASARIAGLERPD